MFCSLVVILTWLCEEASHIYLHHHLEWNSILKSISEFLAQTEAQWFESTEVTHKIASCSVSRSPPIIPYLSTPQTEISGIVRFIIYSEVSPCTVIDQSRIFDPNVLTPREFWLCWFLLQWHSVNIKEN